MPSNDVLALTGSNAEHRWNFQSGIGSAAVVTYSFPTSTPDYATGSDRIGWQAFNATQQADTKKALDIWSANGGVSFVEVPPEIGGGIQFQFVDMFDPNPFDFGVTAGYAYLPYPTYTYDNDLEDFVQRNETDSIQGDVFMNVNLYGDDPNSFRQSGNGFSVLLHEIGHAIAFKHPFEGAPTIDPVKDNWLNTVMTYGPAGDNDDVGTVDKQAMAYLYGTHDLDGSWDTKYEAVVQHGSDVGQGETLVGWDNNDIINANGGNDTIYGFAGQDRVRDGSGNDRVYLGIGDDYIRAGGGRDSFYGGGGDDYISYYDSSKGVTIDFDDDTAAGSWASNDRVEGFEGGSGSKTGDDSFIGTSGANVIRTYGGEDRVAAGLGRDKIYLGDDNDYVRVGGGEESFYGGQGRDYISYYDSSNGVRLDLRDDEVSGSWASNDIVNDFESASGSKSGDDILLGTNGKTTFRGYGGDDKIYGRGGNDKLYGGDGDDFFDGGADTDSLYGGAGADVFHFDKGEDIDVVKDFQNNIDTIELDGFGSNFDAFDYVEQVGDDVVFDFGSGDRLTVEDTSILALRNDLDVV